MPGRCLPDRAPAPAPAVSPARCVHCAHDPSAGGPPRGQWRQWWTPLGAPLRPFPPPSAQNLTLGGRRLPAAPHEGHRERSRTRPGASRERGGRPHARRPVAPGRSLPPARNAGAKEGAPAITSDHEAATSTQALCWGRQSSKTGRPGPAETLGLPQRPPNCGLRESGPGVSSRCRRTSATSSHVPVLTGSVAEKTGSSVSQRQAPQSPPPAASPSTVTAPRRVTHWPRPPSKAAFPNLFFRRGSRRSGRVGNLPKSHSWWEGGRTEPGSVDPDLG